MQAADQYSDYKVEKKMDIQPIAIVTYSTKHFNETVPVWLESIVQVAVAPKIDLTQIMENPMSKHRAHWTEDGSYERTQIAVISQPSFVDGTRAFMNTLKSLIEPAIIPVCCLQGLHCCNTLGRVGCEMANSCVYSDGSRVFNALHVPLAHCMDKTEAELELDQALMWATNPWVLMPTPKEDARFAHTVAMSRPNLMANFKLAWNMVLFIQLPEDIVVEDDDASQCRSAASSSAHRFPQRRDFAPKLPDLPPPPPSPPSTGVRVVPPPIRVDKRPRTTVTVPDAATKAKTWATFEFDVKHWMNTLTLYKVDEVSQRELFLLAQFSETGKQQANHIISEIIKKGANMETVDVSELCKISRNKINIDKRREKF